MRHYADRLTSSEFLNFDDFNISRSVNVICVKRSLPTTTNSENISTKHTGWFFLLFSLYLLILCISFCEYRKHQAHKLFFHFILSFFTLFLSLFISISLSVFATKVNISIKYISCSFILLCLSFSLSVPIFLTLCIL